MLQPLSTAPLTGAFYGFECIGIDAVANVAGRETPPSPHR